MTHLAAVGRAHSASSEYLASLIGGDELTLHQRASSRALSKVGRNQVVAEHVKNLKGHFLFSEVFKYLRVAFFMVLRVKNCCH